MWGLLASFHYGIFLFSNTIYILCVCVFIYWSFIFHSDNSNVN